MAPVASWCLMIVLSAYCAISIGLSSDTSSSHQIVKRFAIASVLNPNAVAHASGVSLFPGPRRSTLSSSSLSSLASSASLSSLASAAAAAAAATARAIERRDDSAGEIYYTDAAGTSVPEVDSAAGTEGGATPSQSIRRHDYASPSYRPAGNDERVYGAGPGGADAHPHQPPRGQRLMGAHQSGNSRRYANVGSSGARNGAYSGHLPRASPTGNNEPTHNGLRLDSGLPPKVTASSGHVRQIAGTARDDLIMERTRHLHPVQPNDESTIGGDDDRSRASTIGRGESGDISGNDQSGANEEPSEHSDNQSYERRSGYQAYGNGRNSVASPSGRNPNDGNSGLNVNSASSYNSGSGSNNNNNNDNNGEYDGAGYESPSYAPDGGTNGPELSSGNAGLGGASVDTGDATDDGSMIGRQDERRYSSSSVGHAPLNSGNSRYSAHNSRLSNANVNDDTTSRTSANGANYRSSLSSGVAPSASNGPANAEEAASGEMNEEQAQSEASTNKEDNNNNSNKPDKLALLLENSKFECSAKKDGYYADKSVQCQVFHYCVSGVKHSWMCPEGTVFHQVHLNCVPNSQDICEQSERYHMVNDYLYKPMDSNGPNKTVRYHQRYYPDEFTMGMPTSSGSADGEQASGESMAYNQQPSYGSSSSSSTPIYGSAGGQQQRRRQPSSELSSSGSEDSGDSNASPNNNNGDSDDDDGYSRPQSGYQAAPPVVAPVAVIPSPAQQAPNPYGQYSSSTAGTPARARTYASPASPATPARSPWNSRTQLASDAPPPGVVHAHARYQATYGGHQGAQRGAAQRSTPSHSASSSSSSSSPYSNSDSDHDSGSSDSEASAQTYSDTATAPYATRYSASPRATVSSQTQQQQQQQQQQQVQPGTRTSLSNGLSGQGYGQSFPVGNEATSNAGIAGGSRQQTPDTQYTMNPYANALLTVARPSATSAAPSSAYSRTPSAQLSSSATAAYNQQQQQQRQPHRHQSLTMPIRPNSYAYERIKSAASLRDSYGNDMSVSAAHQFYHNLIGTNPSSIAVDSALARRAIVGPNNNKPQQQTRPISSSAIDSIDAEKLGALAALASRIMPQIARSAANQAKALTTLTSTDLSSASSSATPAVVVTPVGTPSSAPSPISAESSTSSSSSSPSPSLEASKVPPNYNLNKANSNSTTTPAISTQT